MKWLHAHYLPSESLNINTLLYVHVKKHIDKSHNLYSYINKQPIPYKMIDTALENYIRGAPSVFGN